MTQPGNGGRHGHETAILGFGHDPDTTTQIRNLNRCFFLNCNL